MDDIRTNTILRKPDWLKTKAPSGKTYISVREIVEQNKLHTICTSGHCPNLHECWGRGTATLMILGNICTRACGFCNVITGKPLQADWEEPARVAETIKKMKLKHVVLTSVDRDDLKDKGAGIWALTIQTIKQENPLLTMETLIPDFDGNLELLQMVIDARPNVISHNLETVRRLTPWVRSRAKYDISLKVLENIVKSGIIAKSGIMLGLGEMQAEILETMDDLRSVGVQVMTIGQYLQPSRNHLPVNEFISPETFEYYRTEGVRRGFRYIESAPMVRSSYFAEKHIL